VCVNLVIRLR